MATSTNKNPKCPVCLGTEQGETQHGFCKCPKASHTPESWAESWDKFCKERNWSPINMGVELDHYKLFLKRTLAAERSTLREKIEEKIAEYAIERARTMEGSTYRFAIDGAIAALSDVLSLLKED